MSDIVSLNLPKILDIPPKLHPLITEFNNYDYFLIVGGRGSAKTQSVGRVILYIGQEQEVRIVGGRELLSNIAESVHTVFKDLINEWNLEYDVQASKITHPVSETEIRFKGFREQGAVNVKGLEGVDIVWIDEAQSITKITLDTLLPTIRKAKSKVIFTMNRHLRSDAVYNEMINDPACLVIEINYVDNPHCPLKIKALAEKMKNKNYKDYLHIYMGQPLATADNYLFDTDQLYAAKENEAWGEIYPGRQRVLGIDFAAQGTDQCVASVLDRVTNTHWKLTERISWDEPNTMISTGKIVDLIGKFKPDVTVLDVGGMGHVVFNRLEEVGMHIHRFDGGTTVDVDTENYINLRAQEYYGLKDWFDQSFLIIDEKDQEVIDELEKIKMTYRSDGTRGIQSKKDMKADPTSGNKSPDNADSLMMAVFGTKFIGTSANSHNSKASYVVRRSGTKRKRR